MVIWEESNSQTKSVFPSRHASTERERHRVPQVQLAAHGAIQSGPSAPVARQGAFYPQQTASYFGSMILAGP